MPHLCYTVKKHCFYRHNNAAWADSDAPDEKVIYAQIIRGSKHG